MPNEKCVPNYVLCENVGVTDFDDEGKRRNGSKHLVNE